MNNYIQHRKTADEVVAELDGQITERLARDFGNMTLWHTDAATLLRRYREMAGEISILRAQQETDRATIASLTSRPHATPKARLEMLISQDWLRRKVDADPDIDGDATPPPKDPTHDQ